MDPLSDMLGGIHGKSSSVSLASMESPWAIRFADGAPLTMLTITAGTGAVVLADGTEHKMSAGDTALVRGPEPFHLADSPAALAGPHRSHRASFFDSDADREPGPDGPTALVVGVYRPGHARHERLLRTLPPALVLDEDIEDVLWLSSLQDALARRRRPGGQALIDRVLDWGLVCTLGCWFDRQGAEAPAWYLGAADPVVGPALEAVHRRPAEPWTVAALAAEAKVSRAHFARRFSEVMGQPPLGYLTEWRMSLAEDLLSDPDASVAKVAASVGYRDPFAFSTAFKRLRGMSPREFRDRP